MHRSPVLNMNMLGGCTSPHYPPHYSSEYAQLNVNTRGHNADGNIYVMDQGHVVSPTTLPPIQYVAKNPTIEQISPIQPPSSVEHMPEGITDAFFVYAGQDQAPTSATYFEESAPTYNNFDNYSPTNSYYSGSEASHTDYGFDMEGMHLNSTPQPTQVNTSNVQNGQKKRGRPHKGPSTKGPVQESKNEYMRYYNQIKTVKQELVNLYDQICENLYDQLSCCPTNGPIYQEILKRKHFLEDLEEQKKNRGSSKRSHS
uniref:Uncharacterized protein n=1 Tax=Acrobeloides nanus TaxID=290746 RepID=A0A914CBI7_9BILA